jgi:hypothetical protein
MRQIGIGRIDVMVLRTSFDMKIPRHSDTFKLGVREKRKAEGPIHK